ncbi:MAG: tetratricopeptide repeat protein [Muribaculaceae bacterium]|nr:tetratricopeptide repeat protein [Muribaculaceae bacterium]
MKKMPVIILAIVVTLLSACSEKSHDTRLTRVAELTDSVPEDALALLDSIDASALSDADRHYFDFLTVKASDKAYIDHTSDSLILDVIDYYRGKDLYPEALYYGGRVYSDLGDYPTSLEYFHRSLDLLPSDTENLELRNRVLSQTGRLLDSLSLYDEAIKYINSSLEIGRLLQDTTRIISDLQLLGSIYMRAGQYEQADSVLLESIQLNTGQEIPMYVVKSQMYRAANKYYSNEIDSALILIRNIPEHANPLILNSVLGYASTIYLAAGILDTAFMYSRELVSQPSPMHKEIGYQNLLSPELRSFIRPDSLDEYISRYQDILANYYDENENLAAISEQNLYNYRLHELGKEKAEKVNETLKLWIIAASFVIIAMIVVILLLKIKNKNNIIELHRSIENINRLKQELSRYNEGQSGHSATNIGADNPPSPVSRKQTESELREQLKQELLSLYESGVETQEVPEQITNSEIYQTLKAFIREERPIQEENIWEELERTVAECSPRFKTNLNLLTSGKLTSLDLHTALLIKCGFKPSEMTVLFGRSNGAIISRRETLGLKALDKKTGVKVIDGIIRLL